MTQPSSAWPRVFLSFGRRDAHTLADLLTQALDWQGYAVWRDTAQLRGGLSWEAQIVEALRKSDVVLALLSPHSTRSIAEGGDDDSVCLDELAFARYERPTRPIVPVRAVAGATVPLTVLRLHQLSPIIHLEDRPLASRLCSLAERHLSFERAYHPYVSMAKRNCREHAPAPQAWRPPRNPARR